MTIDQKKRTTMKILATTAGAIAAPAALSAAVGSTGLSANDSVALRGTGLVISFSPRSNISPVSGSRTISITNTSNQPVTLSHVYPGIVSTDNGAYDINSALASGPREFQPNDTTFLQIESVGKQLAERAIPANLQHATKVQVKTASARINHGNAVATTRSMFS